MGLVRVFTGLCFLLFGSFLFGQQKSLKFKDVFLEAETFFFEKEYSNALEMYLPLFENDSANYNLAYRIGECYWNEQLVFKAIDYLKIAKGSMTAKYKEGSVKERDAEYRALFLLGKCYQTIREYSLANQCFTEYKELISPKDVYFYDIAENQIKACDRAQQMVKKPVKVEIENIGKNINAKGNEIFPLVTANDSLLIFTRKVYKEIMVWDERMFMNRYEIYYATKGSDGLWYEIDEITRKINSDGFYIPVSLSADGKTLVLFRDNYENGTFGEYDEGALYFAEFISGRWRRIQKFPEPINSKQWEGSACLSSDGNVIYFSSDRPGSMGGMDIYTSTKEDGEWSEPVGLGDAVNTDFNENYPVLVNDSMMYFASEKHDNIGGYDVFVTKRIGGEWSEPINLGYPINSTGDDIMVSPCLDGKKAYFSSYRPDGYFTFGKGDIYAVDFLQEVKPPKEDEMMAEADSLTNEELVVYTPDEDQAEAESDDDNTTIEGSVVASNYDEIKKPVTVSLVDAETNETVAETFTDPETEEFELQAEPGEYKLVVESEDHVSSEKPVYISDKTPSSVKIESEVVPKNQSGGDYFIIKPVFFEYGSASLTKDAEVELQRLYSLMSENKSLYLEVTGHTDAVSSYSFNKKLSMKRASAVIEYLVAQGIDYSRFLQRGVSFDKNIADNSTEEGRRYNRRVEMKVVKSDTDMVKVQDVVVPEHLRSRSLLQYYVMVDVGGDESAVKGLEDFAKENQLEGETVVQDGAEYYSIGGFTKKGEAAKFMTTLMAKGYENSEIADNFKLRDKKRSVKDVEYHGSYAVQLLGRLKPCDVNDVFNEIPGVIEYECADGYYRYVYGDFRTRSEATEAQEALAQKWHYGAFVVPTMKFEDESFAVRINESNGRNSKGEPKYTIQLYALQKPISETDLKVVDGCDENKGDDGYYRYIYGKFSSYTEAEQAQQGLATQGIEQSFITLLQKFE